MGADDRTKGEWGSMKGFIVGQVRKDELLAKAVVIEGTEERYCRFLFGDECVDTFQLGCKEKYSWSASSSSGDGEEFMLAYKALWATKKELR